MPMLVISNSNIKFAAEVGIVSLMILLRTINLISYSLR